MPATMATPDPNGGSTRLGTHALLDTLSQGDPDELVTFDHLMDDFGERGFGLLLLIATLPAFVPIPVGGLLSGPLVALLGAQMLIGRDEPWLPRWIARRGTRRSAFAGFERRLGPWLERLERLVKPRWPGVVDHRLAHHVTGALLLALGVLLALPIPATNYLFGAALLAFALALLERDGMLLALAWLAGVVLAVAIVIIAAPLFAKIPGAFARIEDGWRALVR